MCILYSHISHNTVYASQFLIPDTSQMDIARYIYRSIYPRPRNMSLTFTGFTGFSKISAAWRSGLRREANWNHRGSHGTLASTQPLARAKSMAKRPLEVRCAASTPGRGLWGLSDISCFYIYILIIFKSYYI